MHSYDYIVIGGGTAGCVLAARLSADPSVTVLLIEAGPADGPAELARPPAWMAALGGVADWRYTTTDQADAGELAYPRGRLLGGSSSINAMMHLRGHRAGYDQWIKAGAPGWGYEDLLPYRTPRRCRGLRVRLAGRDTAAANGSPTAIDKR